MTPSTEHASGAMSGISEDRYISDRTIYGNGYDPKKIVEELKAQARKLVSEVYNEFYEPKYLKRVLDGHLDDTIEVELAVKAILNERKRSAYLAENACLVPPDGGSPTEAEYLVCQEAARRIRGEA